MNGPAVVSKTDIMRLVESGRCHECFEHEHLGLFDVTAIREAIRRDEISFKLLCVGMDQIAPFVRENRVTESARVQALPWTSYESDPGIFIEIPDGSSLMVDGHHRALRREAEGIDHMYFYFIPLDAAIRPSNAWIKNPFVTWEGDSNVALPPTAP